MKYTLPILLLCAATLSAQVVDVPANVQIKDIPSLVNTNVNWLLANKITSTSGSGAPAATCTAGKAMYLNTATGKAYWCSATDTWTLLDSDNPVKNTVVGQPSTDVSPFVSRLHSGGTGYALEVQDGADSYNSIGGILKDANDQLRFSGTSARAVAPLYAASSGTDTYTATTTQAYTAYAAGDILAIRFTNLNTGPSTLNVNSIGAKKVLSKMATELTAGDILADSVKVLVYNDQANSPNGAWMLVSSIDNAATGGGEGSANAVATFTAETSVVFTHNLGTLNVLVQCYDATGAGIGWGAIQQDSANQHTITFSPAASGKCVANGYGGGGAAAWGAVTGTLADQTDLQSALDGKEAANANIQSHISSTSNPHSVSKTQVSLGSVENYGIASQAEAEAGIATDKYMNPLRTAQAIAALAAGGGHTQNTDTGTTSTTFQIDSGNSGPKLKNASGVLEARNAADDAYADMKVRTLEVVGDGNPSEATEATAPAGSPTAGTLYAWADDTNKGQWSKDSSGNTYRDVKPTTATSNQFLTHIGSDGVQTKAQPAFTDISGTAAVAQGGTNLTASTDDNVMVGNGTTWQTKALPDCSNATTSKVLYNISTNAFTCGADQGAGSVSTGVTLTSGQIIVGAGTSAVGVGNLSGDVTTSDGTVTALAAKHKTRQFGFMLGADNGDVLTDTDDQATIWSNQLGSGITITKVWCETDTGTSAINLQRDDGAPANVLSGDLTCSTTGASTTSFSGSEASIADGHNVDLVVVTAAASGTPKRITLLVRYTVD